MDEWADSEGVPRTSGLIVNLAHALARDMGMKAYFIFGIGCLAISETSAELKYLLYITSCIYSCNDMCLKSNTYKRLCAAAEVW